MFRDWGFENFTFDWLVDREMAIYTIVIAGVWQSAGFVMALFLAGLRSVEDEIVKAAKMMVQVYLRFTGRFYFQ